MPLDMIVGTQWGDEGKGRITDYLAAGADLVARAAGGDNAGHTVSVGSQVFRLHLVPSGILHPQACCILGNGMVVNPIRLTAELDELEAQGVDVSPHRLKLSHASHVITTGHLALDGAEEARRGQAELGTTRRGIGPAYSDKSARRGLRAGAMCDPEAFGRQVEESVHRAGEILEAIYHLPAPNTTESGRLYRECAERLRPYLADTGAIVAQALQERRTVLAEGAQGALLDLDHGTYPHVTSSQTTSAGALAGLGVGPRHLRRVVGVAKAFQTRVGGGAFPTEARGEAAERLRGTGENPWDEFGATTGRPRRTGWLDGVLLRYAARLNDITELALTKLDVLSGLPSIPICVAYEVGEQCYEDLPVSPADLASVRPVYEELPGWEAELGAVRDWGELPGHAQRYVERIERLVGLPIRWISVGPAREQIVCRGA